MSCFVPGMSILCHCPPILNTLSPNFSPLFYNLYHSPPPILLSCFLSLHRILPTTAPARAPPDGHRGSVEDTLRSRPRRFVFQRFETVRFYFYFHTGN